MRYFKYEALNNSHKQALKEELKKLNIQEKRAYRKAKIMSIIAIVVFWLVFILVLLGLLYLVSFIPDSDVKWMRIVEEIISGILFIPVVLFSAIIGGLASLPFWSIQDNNQKEIRQRLRSAVCLDLRKFYGLCEPMLVTKCYKCTNEKFNDHDICLFFVDGELRITTNLQYGFYNHDKDLGCYAFVKDEISLSRIQTEHYYATEIIAGDFRLVLGIKAKTFIEKNSD